MFCIDTLINKSGLPENTSTLTFSDNVWGTFSKDLQKIITINFPPGSASDYNKKVGEITWGLCIFYFKTEPEL